jgi:hypothetical protein
MGIRLSMVTGIGYSSKTIMRYPGCFREKFLKGRGIEYVFF